MKPSSIHQLLAGFAHGDAISHEALALRTVCRELGYDSEIYAPSEHIAPESTDECRPLVAYRQSTADVVIGHYSIASAATGMLLSSPARKILIYHNITPSEFFIPFDTALAGQLVQARLELKDTLARVDAIWADSAFNVAELHDLGAPHAKVFPLLFQPSGLDIPPDPIILAKFAVPMKNILFVGRMAPNKCIEELITAFAWFHKNIEPQSRLLLVGSDQSSPAYYAMLKMYVAELGLDTVFFERFASPAGLVAYYRVADCFATTSRHEGYCLPLVEAMHMGIPVVARRVGGTPEAMGHAGVMVDDVTPEELAEVLGLVCHDGAVKRAVLDGQKKRIAEVLNRPVRDEFLALLSDVVSA